MGFFSYSKPVKQKLRLILVACVQLLWDVPFLGPRRSRGLRTGSDSAAGDSFISFEATESSETLLPLWHFVVMRSKLFVSAFVFPILICDSDPSTAERGFGSTQTSSRSAPFSQRLLTRRHCECQNFARLQKVIR